MQLAKTKNKHFDLRTFLNELEEREIWYIRFLLQDLKNKYIIKYSWEATEMELKPYKEPRLANYKWILKEIKGPGRRAIKC